MISCCSRRALAMSAVLGLALSCAMPAAAHDYAVGSLRIDHLRIPPTPNAAPTAAGYLSISNTGKLPDRLLTVSTPAADTVAPHHMSMTHGVMSMRPIQGGVAIGPEQTVTFAPGGDHLMLIGLKHSFVAGQRVPATLRFERAGTVRVEFLVERAPIAPSGMDHMGHIDMH